jgi:hypothetical protein
MIDYTSSQLLWPIVTSISSVAHLNGRNDILVPIISCSLLFLDLLRGYRVIINVRNNSTLSLMKFVRAFWCE